MQSSLSELFIAEHDIILEAGDLISLNRNLWKSRPAEYKKKINQLLDFFSVYADKFHHHKEEEILFPAIIQNSETTGAAIVQELNEQHEEFRHLMQQILAALYLDDFASVQQFLESYVSKLKDHIAVENNELFPMADAIFSGDELEKLYYKCIDKDRELGMTFKEESERMIKNSATNEAIQ
jgi:hemerythrin-like domain-containing protein